jgi:glycosyltransferase involved in cell wall biosynthesis
VKIHFITPFFMQWIEGYKRIFKDHLQKWTDVPTDLGADVTVFFWCDKKTIEYINTKEKNGKWVVFVRRYEYYAYDLETVRWDKVDSVIVVNDFIAGMLEAKTGVKPHVIYNGVSLDKWTYRKREHGNRVACVGFVHMKKNYPLAMQIMSMVPRDYELHIVGGVQDEPTLEYLMYLAYHLRINMQIHGMIPANEIDAWLDDKNYLLCTAITEGNPNNVIEAMAKGIKPLVHAWPGSVEQFNEHVFFTAEEAARMIHPESKYDSEKYRRIVEERFSLSNYEKVREIVLGEAK